MINVLARLAELDRTDHAGEKSLAENVKVDECGPMEMSSDAPKTPATLNITAASGEELGDMLNAIMQLAGVHPVGDDHMGVDHPPAVLTTEPSMTVGSHASDSIRSVLDQMNDMGDDEARENVSDDDYGIPGVDTTPANPHKQLPFDANEFSQDTNDGDGDDKKGRPRLTTQPTATFENLMAEYQDFLKEGSYGGDAYDRDYASSIAGMDGSDKRDFKRREMDHELGHETNNYAVTINGKTWKVFASKSHAESVAKKIMMRDPNKKVSVHETGSEVSEDMVPTVDQGEYDREGDMVKDNLMTIKREVEELYKILDNNENIPEWVEDKIAQVKGMMTSASEYMQTQHERGEEHDMMEGEGDEAYVACIVQHNRSGQAMVQRTKPISRDRAEEVIRHALSKNTFVHPPFMTIYPASAGKLDGSTIMAQFPDMSKEGLAEGKVCSSCNMPMKKCSCD